jgi:tetratricopeptide (TPR) repeat protein
MPSQTATAAPPQQPVTTFASSPAPIPATDSAATREALTQLRQAEDAASRGDLTHASETYIRIANAQNVAREVIAEAAVGLYRIGSYRESAAAFRRVGTFAKGEEDLRYYFAVALYESGEYQAAERELACALPFIEATEDVLRYRWKIENTAAVVAMK